MVGTGNRSISHDYDLGGVLGQGGFGMVHRAKERQSGVARVLKIVSRHAVDNPVALDNEVAIHADLDHPNIVRLFESSCDASNLYIVMELCRGGDLCDVLEERRCISEREARVVFEQVLQAVHYMHSRGLAHRDVKLENFLLAEQGVPLQENTVKLADFGLAAPVALGVASLKTICGSAMYMAPEVLAKRGYDEKCDEWSCGVLLYILLCGEQPFAGQSVQDMARSLQSCLTFAEPEWQTISPQAEYLVRRLCDKRLARRWSAKEAMESPWVQQEHSESDWEEPLLTAEMCENARRFVQMNSFQKAALQRVAYQLDAAEVAPIKEAFLLLDVDRDGRLTLEELRRGLTRDASTTGFSVEGLFQQADFDHNGAVEYTEFVTAMMNHSKQCFQAEVCWPAFRSLDKDGGGRIAIGDLHHALAPWGFSSQRERDQARAMLKKVDRNGDGRIDFQEFLAALHGHSGAEVAGVVQFD